MARTPTKPALKTPKPKYNMKPAEPMGRLRATPAKAGGKPIAGEGMPIGKLVKRAKTLRQKVELRKLIMFLACGAPQNRRKSAKAFGEVKTIDLPGKFMLRLGDGTYVTLAEVLEKASAFEVIAGGKRIGLGEIIADIPKYSGLFDGSRQIVRAGK